MSRVLEEIEYKVFKRPRDIAIAIAFAIAYALVFATYLVNRIEPMVGGMSFVFFYSLLVWILIIVLTFVAAITCWR